MSTIDPAILAQLRQMYAQNGFGAGSSVGAYSPIGVQGVGEGGVTNTFQGYSSGRPGNGELFTSSGMGGAAYPKGGLNPTDLEQAIAFLGAFALGGQGLGALAGGTGGVFGAGAAVDGAGGMALQEGAYPTAFTAGDSSLGTGAIAGGGGFAGDATAAGYDPAYGALDSGAPNTAIMGGAPAASGVDGAGGMSLAEGGYPSSITGGATGGAITGGGSGSSSLASLLGLGGGGGSSALGGYGSLIGPATNLVGGLLGANAAKQAAGAQVQASNNSLALQRDIYNTQLGLQAPYRDAGAGALTQLSTLLGTGGSPSAPGYGSLTKPFGMSDFQLDPGIKFQTQQGNLALQNSQAARDGVLSGGALKDLIGYNQGMAGTGYQNAYERYMNNNAATYSRLMGVTGLGQAAASNSAANAGAFGQSAGNTLVGIGNAQAAGDVGSTNAITGGLNNIGNMYYLQNLLNQQRAPSSPQSTG